MYTEDPSARYDSEFGFLRGWRGGYRAVWYLAWCALGRYGKRGHAWSSEIIWTTFIVHNNLAGMLQIVRKLSKIMTPIQYVLIILNILWLQYASERILNYPVQLITIWYDYDYNTIRWLYLINIIIHKAPFWCALRLKLWTGSRSGELHPFSLSLPHFWSQIRNNKFSRLFWCRLQGKWTGLRHSCTLTLDRHSFGLYGFHQDYCTFSVMCCNRDQGLFELQLFSLHGNALKWWKLYAYLTHCYLL